MSAKLDAALADGAHERALIDSAGCSVLSATSTSATLGSAAGAGRGLRRKARRVVESDHLDLDRLSVS